MPPKIALLPPNPAIRIRPVRAHDIDYMVGIFWQERPKGAIIELVKRAQNLARQGRGLGVVVMGKMETQLQAYGQLTMWPHIAEISDLYVLEGYRRRGIGTTLIQYLTRCAREMHAPAVEIGVALSNTPALNLYRWVGFEARNELLLDSGNGLEPVLYLQIQLAE